MRKGGLLRSQVLTYEDGGFRARRDSMATEEPLEIRLRAGGKQQRVGITMRTPGNDFELAAGLLFAEGIIQSHMDIQTMRYCVDAERDGEQLYNIVSVDLRANHLPELAQLERVTMATSACGVCGRASLDQLEQRGCGVLQGGPPLDPELLCALPAQLRAAQSLFSSTGGLHAAALFTAEGELIELREDIGRHNAVDKLVGWALLQAKLPLDQHILLVSGRAGYEIVQKALVAGITSVCSVSAPSSLAVELARRFGMTLVGFLREKRFNVYAGQERVVTNDKMTDDTLTAGQEIHHGDTESSEGLRKCTTEAGQF